MDRHEKIAKSRFVIKLTSETVLKLSEEKKQAKTEINEALSGNILLNEVEQTSKESASKSVQNIPLDKKHSSLADSAEVEGDDKRNQQFKEPEEEATATIALDKTKTDDSKSDDKSELWKDYSPYISYEGEEAVYTDPSTQHKYTWNKTTNAWDSKAGDVPGRVYSYEDDTHIYTEPDGSKSFWDIEKKAWLPKVDDDFMAFYQMSYGFVDNASKDQEQKEETKKKDDQKKFDPSGVKRKAEPQWFQPTEETNTKVYVSNLPLDLTEEEFVNFMQKCGLVERDASTQNMKVKLYMDKQQNCFKGDALCTYIKIESVDLALKLLDGCDFKGNKIKVEQAHFQLKGEYNPALKPKKKRKKELEKIKKMQQKLFDWRPEKFVGERSKHERIVIVKNLFHPSDFDNEVQLILDYQQDLREECGKSGEVRKVVIYDRHPEGVAQITMKEPEQADAVVQLINGRWFGKRQISAEIWDGRTKYRIAETDADISKRINKWDKFLEGKEEDKNTESGAAVEAAVVDANQISSTELENEVVKKQDKFLEGMEEDKSIESGPAAEAAVVDPNQVSCTELENKVVNKPDKFLEAKVEDKNTKVREAEEAAVANAYHIFSPELESKEKIITEVSNEVLLELDKAE